MRADRVERILAVVKRKLESDTVPDNYTGSFKLNLQSGMLAGKITKEEHLDVQDH